MSELDELTPREREVLQLVAHGLTNEAIADTLVITKDTVQTHISHILTKLRVHSRWQAADICNGHLTLGAGGYTPGTTHHVEAYQPDGSYDGGSGGAVTVYMTQAFFNGQLAATGWILTYGSQLRADANSEYYPGTYLNPVGRVCYGSGAPSSSCTSSSYPVQRLVSATWSNWSSSETNFSGSFGYQRNNQTTNYRFNVTSAY